jgi:hypothetical protein
VGVLVSPADGAGSGVSLGFAVAVALTDGAGVIDGSGVALGEELGAWLGPADGNGETVGVGEVFFFFRCFGVAAGRTKSFFNLSPNVSSRSCVPRTTTVLIAIVIAITNTRRSFLFTPMSGSASQFL